VLRRREQRRLDILEAEKDILKAKKAKELSRKYRTVLLNGEGLTVLVDILDILHWPNLTEDPTVADVILAGAASRILNRIGILQTNTLEEVVLALAAVHKDKPDAGVIPTVEVIVPPTVEIGGRYVKRS